MTLTVIKCVQREMKSKLWPGFDGIAELDLEYRLCTQLCKLIHTSSSVITRTHKEFYQYWQQTILLKTEKLKDSHETRERFKRLQIQS